MVRFFAKEQVLDAKGRHVADRVTPVCRSIAMVEKKLLQQRETFPLKEGQRFAGRIYVYTAKKNNAGAHGIYEFMDGKLKRLRNSSCMNSFIDSETLDRDHTYPSIVINYYQEVKDA